MKEECQPKKRTSNSIISYKGLISSCVGLIFIVFFCFEMEAQQPKEPWLFNSGGKEMDCGYSIDIDTSGYIYVSGRFGDNMSLDSFLLEGDWYHDDQAFVAKFDQDGNVVWAQTIIGHCDITSYNVRVNSEQNIIISGTSDNDITIGDFTLDLIANRTVLFIAEFGPDGSLHWGKHYGSTERGDQGNERKQLQMAIDNNDNIIITAPFSSWGTTIDTLDIDVSGQYRGYYYIAKFDNKGNVIWGNSLHSDNQGEILGLTIDCDNNILIAGYHYRGELYQNDTSLNIAGKNYSGYVIKYSENGNFTWHKGQNTYPKCITSDVCKNYYLTNNHSVEKFDSSGQRLWYKKTLLPMSAIYCDNENNLHVSGTDRSWSGNMIIDYDTVVFGQSFIAKLTSEGGVLYLKSVGRTQTFFVEMTADSDGIPYLTGTYFDGAIISDSTFQKFSWFNNETGDSIFTNEFYSPPLESQGYLDLFVAKFTTPNSVDSMVSLVQEKSTGSQLSIYPNPTKSDINILFENEDASPVELTIFSIDGKQMFRKSYNKDRKTLDIKIPVECWKSGVYVCKFQQQYTCNSQMIIVE